MSTTPNSAADPTAGYGGPTKDEHADVLTHSARKAVAALQNYGRPWHVAGGWAIDLFLGHRRREHKDIDVAILREDQHRLREVLAAYPMFKLVDRQLRSWDGAPLEAPDFQLFADGDLDGSNAWEFLIEDVVDGEWVYRRERSVRLPISRAFCQVAVGVPCLAPEIVLLFKSKHLSDVDQCDFDHTLPSLPRDRRRWLGEAIRGANKDHPWLATLGGLHS